MSTLQYAETDAEIDDCFETISVLRPHLSRQNLIPQVRRQQTGGYRMAYVRDAESSRVATVAGFRFTESLSWGKFIYIDDLVSHPDFCGKGYAGGLLDEIIALAREKGCDAVHLDSGHVRFDAHRLYLNHGFKITAHHFGLNLSLD